MEPIKEAIYVATTGRRYTYESFEGDVAKVLEKSAVEPLQDGDTVVDDMVGWENRKVELGLLPRRNPLQLGLQALWKGLGLDTAIPQAAKPFTDAVGHNPDGETTSIIYMADDPRYGS